MKKKQQTSIAKLTKNMMIIDLMKTMGWPRERAEIAIEELEAVSLIQFPNQGGMRMRVNVEVN
ncbi:hypothetical protein MKY69_03975 [Streptococcus sp. FSL R7-0212]|uniref:hypothetical protein n=1 Tax=Streptococcus sp. FSL R7-0212 TaxID=2921726 RepID=UPI0012A7CF0C|nr:hypothetical protein [Streptococcus dysgalactiae]QGG97245.1 hypothetical protein EA459_00400 [Streptococcus dysgalactiae subsp. dysgalactiae]